MDDTIETLITCFGWLVVIAWLDAIATIAVLIYAWHRRDLESE